MVCCKAVNERMRVHSSLFDSVDISILDEYVNDFTATYS